MHKGNIRNKDEKGTKLSSYIWELKAKNIDFELKWKYIAKAAAYTPSSGTCYLKNDLLDNALNFASNYAEISQQEREIILKSKSQMRKRKSVKFLRKTN